MITRAITAAGRQVVGWIFRTDLRGGVAKISKVAAEQEAQRSDAKVPLQWMGLFARNFELTIYWLVIWMLAHFGMIAIGGLILGTHAGMNSHVLIPIEVIPGGMFAISVARLGPSMGKVEQMENAVDSNRRVDTEDAWPQTSNPFLMRLLTPSDVDLYVIVAFAALLEVVLAPRLS